MKQESKSIHYYKCIVLVIRVVQSKVEKSRFLEKVDFKKSLRKVAKYLVQTIQSLLSRDRYQECMQPCSDKIKWDQKAGADFKLRSCQVHGRSGVISIILPLRCLHVNLKVPGFETGTLGQHAASSPFSSFVSIIGLYIIPFFFTLHSY